MIIYHIKGTKKRMKTKNKRNYLKQDGITLIALVVTIVVLLILAGVSINALFGQDGIIQKAKDAQNKMDEATQNDLDAINGLNEWINKNINGTNGGEDIEKGDFSATVVLNPAENETQPTFEQKKEIAAILCDFSSYEELTQAYTDLNMTEEQLVNKIIEVGRKFINYSNDSEVEKLKDLGVKVITVETPYGSTLYTSNLGEPVKCSFNKNGSYDFIIKSGATEVKKTVTIDNIRTESTNAPYKVKAEILLEDGQNLLYSTDETNDWKELKNNTVIECNNAVNIKFAGEQPTETNGEGLHYVEKNNEYYKYFNDEQPMEWGAIRSSYALGWYIALNNNQKTIRQIVMAGILRQLQTGSTSDYLSKVVPGLYTVRTINFLNEFPEAAEYKIGGQNKKFTDAMSQKYSELELGYDNVITWSESGESTSPVYKIEVDHDMSLIVHKENWD